MDCENIAILDDRKLKIINVDLSIDDYVVHLAVPYLTYSNLQISVYADTIL